MSTNREFFYRRLHSLLGVIPLGAFIIFHFVVNHTATRGEEAFNQAAGAVENVPFLLAAEFLLIYIPILFHGIYGLYIAFQARNNTGNYGYFRNWMFRLQRITGVIVIIFVAWHVWDTRIAKALGQEVNFDMMADIVANPISLVLYIIAIIATSFHFANGLWSFAVTWGITVSPRSQRIFTYASMVVFLIISYIGVSAILAFV